jgi:hypothetical protein
MAKVILLMVMVKCIMEITTIKDLVNLIKVLLKTTFLPYQKIMILQNIMILLMNPVDDIEACWSWLLKRNYISKIDIFSIIQKMKKLLFSYINHKM